MNDRADYQAAFDQHGEAYVREMFEAGRYSGMVADEARHWLAAAKPPKLKMRRSLAKRLPLLATKPMPRARLTELRNRPTPSL